MRASHPTLLRLAVTFAALAAPGLAQACDFYRTAETRMEVFDMPITGSGLAVSILPSGSSACVVESRTDNAGNSWDRIDFYMHENVRYSAAGWLPGGSVDNASDAAPGEAATGATAAAPAMAASAETGGSKEAFFASSWALAPAQSSINFLSTKKGNVTEVHRFNELSGTIAPDGTATVSIGLESVQTGVDIRDVRMRFLLFQVDTYEDATITAKIDPAAVSAIWEDMRLTTEIPFTLNLHGVEKELLIPVTISRLGQGMVSVASAKPFIINAVDFALDGGIAQLSEAVGNIGISANIPVDFDLIFAASLDG